MDLFNSFGFQVVVCMTLALCIVILAGGWHAGVVHVVAVYLRDSVLVWFLVVAMIFGSWDLHELDTVVVL